MCMALMLPDIGYHLAHDLPNDPPKWGTGAGKFGSSHFNLLTNPQKYQF